MQIIPLKAVPSQALRITLGGQVCQINVYLKGAFLYVDILVDDVLIIGGVIAQNLNRIVRSLYLGFSGDMAFIDNQGSDDPQYPGLGTRWSLAYLSPDELNPGEG